MSRQDGELEDIRVTRWQEEQERRKQRVGKVCRYYQDLMKVSMIILHFFSNSQVPKAYERKAWIYSGQHSLLYCRHAKVQLLQVLQVLLWLQVGTTTWLAQFLALSNLTEARKVQIKQSSKLLHSVVAPLFWAFPSNLSRRCQVLDIRTRQLFGERTYWADY